MKPIKKLERLLLPVLRTWGIWSFLAYGPRSGVGHWSIELFFEGSKLPKEAFVAAWKRQIDGCRVVVGDGKLTAQAERIAPQSLVSVVERCLRELGSAASLE